VHERVAVSVDDLTLYPLFTEEIIGLMRALIPAARQRAVATSIVVTAELRDGPSPG
jgi:arsenite methyltransferase